MTRRMPGALLDRTLGPVGAAGQRGLDGGREQAGLAGGGPVHRLHRHVGRRGDRRDGRAGVAALDEQPRRRLDDAMAGLGGLPAPTRRVVAAAGGCGSDIEENDTGMNIDAGRTPRDSRTREDSRHDHDDRSAHSVDLDPEQPRPPPAACWRRSSRATTRRLFGPRAPTTSSTTRPRRARHPGPGSAIYFMHLLARAFSDQRWTIEKVIVEATSWPSLHPQRAAHRRLLRAAGDREPLRVPADAPHPDARRPGRGALGGP